jgi:ribosomal protein L14
VKRPFSAMLVMTVMAVVAASAANARNASPQDQTASPISPVQALVLNGKHAPASEVAQNPEVNVRDGQPLTAVVVTQCNLVVAVYFTMQDGKLVRFDKNAGSSIKAEDLVTLAYNSAKRSERVEVGCDTPGLKGTEPHSRTDL